MMIVSHESQAGTHVLFHLHNLTLCICLNTQSPEKSLFKLCVPLEWLL